MASNELAAILARRRAKDGSGSEAQAISTPTPSQPSARSASTLSQGGSAPSRSSIAERIARLQQGGGGNETPAPVPQPFPIPINRTASMTIVNSNDPLAPPPQQSQEAAIEAPIENSSGENRKTSDKIASLQGNLKGFGINPFRPGAPPPKRTFTSGESILTTGEHYAQNHAMTVAMPGMGAAIPMPGLAKADFKLPVTASEESAHVEPTPVEVTHANMARAAGPKRRAPSRAPPGAVRVPMMEGPILLEKEPKSDLVSTKSEVEPIHTDFIAQEKSMPKDTQLSESVTFPKPATLFPESTLPVSSTRSIPAPVPIPTPVQQLATPGVHTKSKFDDSDDSDFSDDETTPARSGSVTPLTTTSLQPELPTAELKEVSSPPVQESPSASLFGSMPVGELKESPSTAIKQPSTPSLFPDASVIEHSVPVSAAQVSESVVESTPSSLSITRLSISETKNDPVTSGSVAPPIAPTTGTSTSLFGPAGVKDDDSSESDWSDDEDDHTNKPATIFGAPIPQTVRNPPSVNPPVMKPSSSKLGASSLFGEPATAASAKEPTPPVLNQESSLFGTSVPASFQSSSTISDFSVASAATPEFSSATAPSIVPPPKMQSYSTLFGGSDDDSSESDDEGGLFGTGLPTKR